MPSRDGHVRAVLTDPFVAQYIAAPPEVQKRFGQQLAHLLRNLRHPSLHAKKYDEARDRWQARVNDNWRMYFRIESDAYVLLEIVPHPKMSTARALGHRLVEACALPSVRRRTAHTSRRLRGGRGAASTQQLVRAALL